MSNFGYFQTYFILNSNERILNKPYLQTRLTKHLKNTKNRISLLIQSSEFLMFTNHVTQTVKNKSWMYYALNICINFEIALRVYVFVLKELNWLCFVNEIQAVCYAITFYLKICSVMCFKSLINYSQWYI